MVKCRETVQCTAGVSDVRRIADLLLRNISILKVGDCALLSFLVHGQVTIIFVVSVCLFVCAEFFSAVFDPISIKLGHMTHKEDVII